MIIINSGCGQYSTELIIIILALRRQLLPRSSERKRFTISEGSSVSTTRGSKVEVAWIGSFIGSFM